MTVVRIRLQQTRSPQLRSYDNSDTGVANDGMVRTYTIDEVDVPLSVFYGDDDHFASPSDIKAFLAKYEKLEFATSVKNYGHMDFLWGSDTPSTFHTELLAALARVNRLHTRDLHIEIGSLTDAVEGCQEWAEAGECSGNPTFMRTDCAKTCQEFFNVCRNQHDNDECDEWSKQGHCGDGHAEFMHQNCQLSCGMCAYFAQGNEASRENQCKDTNRHCVEWASQGDCVKNRDFMHADCKASCRLC